MYQQYGTGYYGGGYYNNNNNMGAYQQPPQSQQISPYTFLPLTFVNNVDDVNRFVVPLNQSVYLRDSNSNTLYIKSTNTQGQTSIEQFKLVRFNEENSQQGNEYVTKQDFNALNNAFIELRKSIEDFINKDSKKEVVTNDK